MKSGYRLEGVMVGGRCARDMILFKTYLWFLFFLLCDLPCSNSVSSLMLFFSVTLFYIYKELSLDLYSSIVCQGRVCLAVDLLPCGTKPSSLVPRW